MSVKEKQRQKECNARLMSKDYIKNTLFLIFILKQYFVFCKIVHKSLQVF